MTTILTVIVPTFEDDLRLQKCLNALSVQDFCHGHFEVIVVNNSDVELSINRPPMDLTIISERKPGSYAARNCGLLHARGEIVAFTDSDCIPDSQWLQRGVDALVNQGADRIAGKVTVFPKASRMTAVECYESIFAFNQKSSVRSGVAVTANLFVRSTVFEAVGVFDSRLFSGGDIEWNKRATNDGFSILYEETAIIHHPARHSWRELSKKLERTTGGAFVIDPAYNINALRALVPPIEAGRKIFKSEKSFRTKFLAFFIAYRIKLKKLIYVRRLRAKMVKPPRS